MDVRSIHTVAEAERIIIDLEGRATDTSLRIATNARHHAAGGDPAMVQALVTWAQTQRTARLRTYVDEGNSDQATDLASHLPGLCAILLCDEALSATGIGIRPELRSAASTRLKLLQGQNPRNGTRGPQLEILCVDHLNRSHPALLYKVASDGAAELKPEASFTDVARLALRATLQGSAAALQSELVGSLGDALYELFRNTDEHARTDVTGNHLRRSIRGIHARRHDVTPEALANMVKESLPLAEYCRRHTPRPGRPHLQLLEISVFDSGPGMAARWKSCPSAMLDEAAERSAIEECFKKHHTTKRVNGRGMGLPIVVAALRERDGFLRVRSGRQALFADLGADPHRAFGDEPLFRSWSSRRNPAPAAGTLVTFLLPVDGTP